MFCNPSTLLIWCLECKKEINSEKSSAVKAVFVNSAENGKNSKPAKKQASPKNGDKSSEKSSSSIKSNSLVNKEIAKKKLKGVAGLKNLGNSCYMNAGIQCLSNIRSIQRYFLKIIDFEELKRNENPEEKLITSFSSLLKEIWDDSSSTSTPKVFSDALKDSCSFFKGMAQHDSQEFLRIFLDKLHESLKFEYKPGCERSIVSDTFKTEIQTRVTCTECGNFSIREEEYYDIPVSIPSSEEIEFYKKFSSEVRNPQERVTFNSEKHSLWSKIQQVMNENKSITSIYDCLLNFCLPEELKQKYNCARCDRKTLSRREVKILKPANTLMVVVKRFKYNKSGLKVSTYVQYPLCIDLRFFLTRNVSCQYQLTGLIQHIGGMNGGHYISFCKNYRNNNWYEFDDTRTRLVTEQQVLEKEAYILFYQRQIPEKREKFRRGEKISFIPSYWGNLYYTQTDPGIIHQNYLICAHGCIRPGFSLTQFTGISSKQDAELRSIYSSDGQQKVEIEYCKKCLIDFTALNMRAEAELDLLNELNSIVPFEGPWYLIASSWLDCWKKYCAHENFKANYLPPPVDNTGLFEDGCIRKSLQPGKDYRGVNRHVWSAFIYLYKGGPEIPRLEINIYSDPAPKIECVVPSLSPEHISKLKSIQRHYSNN